MEHFLRYLIIIVLSAMAGYTICAIVSIGPRSDEEYLEAQLDEKRKQLNEARQLYQVIKSFIRNHGLWLAFMSYIELEAKSDTQKSFINMEDSDET